MKNQRRQILLHIFTELLANITISINIIMWECYAGFRRCRKGNIVPLDGALIPQLHLASYSLTVQSSIVVLYGFESLDCIYSLTLGYFQSVTVMLHFVVEYFSKTLHCSLEWLYICWLSVLTPNYWTQTEDCSAK